MVLGLTLFSAFAILAAPKRAIASESEETGQAPKWGLLKTIGTAAGVLLGAAIASAISDNTENSKNVATSGTQNAKLANEPENKEPMAVVEQLCAELLNWAEDWMIENPNGCVYSEEARDLLEVLDAEDDLSYICCDVYDDRKEGYAITDEGFYFRDSGIFSGTNYFYSFDELGEAKISLEGGFVYVDDQCVNIGLSDLESKKLYKLLRKISRLFYLEDDDDE